jgi:hypothetical protein
VVPAWKLAELLSVQDLVEQRSIEDERLAQQLLSSSEPQPPT